MENHYSIATYCRLSKMDIKVSQEKYSNKIRENRIQEKNKYTQYLRNTVDESAISMSLSESESIKNQQNLLHRYIENMPEYRKCKIIDFYDDGFTGTNFKRPSFEKLIDTVRRGEINCIIVKDFSRFGRDYLELGDYLEQIFPCLGIRFISINDNYDSKKLECSAGHIDSAFMNVVYDYYSKDISKKITSSINSRKKRGTYVANMAFFGYKKVKESKSLLHIDEQAAIIVRKIFDLAVKGENSSGIAYYLNKNHVPTPAKYSKENDKKFPFKTINEDNAWSSVSVARILRNERYTGKYIESYIEDGQKKEVVISDQYEQIISQEIFNNAQNSLRQFKHRSQRKDDSNILKHLVKCGYCKNNMTRIRSGDKEHYYHQCRIRKYTDEYGCYQGSIKEEIILETMLFAIRYNARLAIDTDKILKNHKNTIKSRLVEVNSQRKEKQEKLNQLQDAKVTMYDRYKDGVISKDEFLKTKSIYSTHVANLEKEIDCLELQVQFLNKEVINKNKIIDNFIDYELFEELPGNLIEQLVDAIYIYNQEKIEIRFKYGDEYNKFCKIINPKLEDKG